MLSALTGTAMRTLLQLSYPDPHPEYEVHVHTRCEHDLVLYLTLNLLVHTTQLPIAVKARP